MDADPDQEVVGTGGSGTVQLRVRRVRGRPAHRAVLFGLTGLIAGLVALLLVGAALLVSGAIIGLLLGGPPL